MKLTRFLPLMALVAVMALSACGKSSSTGTPSLGDIANIDTGALKDSGAKISAAGAMCSQASGKISGLTQDMLKAVKAKDLATAQSVGTELSAAADDLHQSATDMESAASGLSSLPAGAGDQAVKGVTAAAKVCGATGDFAESVATDVANASGADAYKELEKALNKLSDDAAKAGQEANSAGSGI